MPIRQLTHHRMGRDCVGARSVRAQCATVDTAAGWVRGLGRLRYVRLLACPGCLRREDEIRGCADTGPNDDSDQNREQDASFGPGVVLWSEDLLWSTVWSR